VTVGIEDARGSREERRRSFIFEGHLSAKKAEGGGASSAGIFVIKFGIIRKELRKELTGERQPNKS